MSEQPPDDKQTRKSPPPVPSHDNTQKRIGHEVKETIDHHQTGAWAGDSLINLPSQTSGPFRIGRFEVRQLLGEGAFAAVYLGFDPELEREVAIKVPKAEGLTPEAQALFLRENRLAAIIQHPNICPIYDVGTHDGRPYIVMRVVPNTLAGLLKRLGGAMPARTAVAVARKLALGLVAAHAQKVIHRDLKPANILYDEANREVLIADFGLARFLGDSVASDNKPKGTPAYMAPEQVRGKASEIGPRCDVYALGVILYEMLVGRIPFTGTVWEVMFAHCDTPPVPPSALRPNLDPRLDALVLKALAKEPKDRYASAKEFGRTLADYLRSGEQTRSAQPPSDALELPYEIVADFAGPPAVKVFELDDEPPRPRPVPPPLPALPPAKQEPPVWVKPRRRSRWKRRLALAGLLLAAVVAGRYAFLNRYIAKPVEPSAQVGATPGEVATLTFGDPAVEMRMRWIPAGSFLMGSNTEGPDERPVHKVTLTRGFWMAETETTQAQWRAMMSTNPSTVKGDSLPVESVTWHDANEFCKRLSTLTGKSMSLPSEAQWEYACRAGTTTKYHSGDTVTDLKRVAWYEVKGGRQPHAVGLKEANAWGLRDMHGNVLEWCSDGPRQYDGVTQTDPVGPINEAIPRTLRGGSYHHPPSAADRDRAPQTLQNDAVGFRVCWHPK